MYMYMYMNIYVCVCISPTYCYDSFMSIDVVVIHLSSLITLYQQIDMPQRI